MRPFKSKNVRPIEEDTLYEINMRYGVSPVAIRNSTLLTDIDDLNKELEKLNHQSNSNRVISVLNHLVASSEKLRLINNYYEAYANQEEKIFVVLDSALPELEKKALKDYIVMMELNFTNEKQTNDTLINNIEALSAQNYKNVVCVLNNFNYLSEAKQNKVLRACKNKDTTFILMSQIIHDVVMKKEVKSLYKVEQENFNPIIIGA
jgi:predicted RNA-binding protein with PIN domain